MRLQRFRLIQIGLVLFFIIPILLVGYGAAPPPVDAQIAQLTTSLNARQATSVWFGDLGENRPLTENMMGELASYTYAELNQVVTENSVSDDLVEDIAPRILFISVSDGNSRAYVNWGSGLGLLSALNDAVTKTNAQLPPDYQARWIKVDVVNTVEDYSATNVFDKFNYDRTLYGLAFDAEYGLAFLPQELVVNTLINSDSDFRLNNMVNYLVKQPNSSSVEAIDQLNTAGIVNVYTFTTQSYFTDGDNGYALYRGHRLITASTPDEWLEASRLGGQYLTAATTENGRFVYAYLPKTDEERADYNALRHAGALYAMSELYEVSQDPELLAAIERGIDYLFNELIKPCTAYYTQEDVLCVVEGDEVKLGGNGLALLALAKYTTVTGDAQYLPMMRSLASWIVGSQLDNGDFAHKLIYSTGALTNFRSSYYTGEALFGLLRFYAIDNDPRWLDAADKGARFLILVRDADVPTSSLPHDHWFLYALNEVYRFNNDQLFIDHTLRLVNAILPAQHKNAIYPDWNGGYYTPPRSTPVATRSEGLCAAYALLNEFSPDDAPLVREAILAGLNFQLQSLFQPETLMYLPNPNRAAGGFHRDYENYEIRIDYNQHNMSAFLCARRMIIE